MDRIRIKILTDFSVTPGVREEIEGDDPGEKFLSDILLPKFEEARSKRAILEIDMDGVAGYPTSFLEAAFGGLVRHYNDIEIVRETIRIISEDDPFLQEDIDDYIQEALDK